MASKLTAICLSLWLKACDANTRHFLLLLFYRHFNRCNMITVRLLSCFFNSKFIGLYVKRTSSQQVRYWTGGIELAQTHAHTGDFSEAQILILHFIFFLLLVLTLFCSLSPLFSFYLFPGFLFLSFPDVFFLYLSFFYFCLISFINPKIKISRQENIMLLPGITYFQKNI